MALDRIIGVMWRVDLEDEVRGVILARYTGYGQVPFFSLCIDWNAVEQLDPANVVVVVADPVNCCGMNLIAGWWTIAGIFVTHE